MEREFGKPPHDPREKMRGLEEAISSTRERIEEYEARGFDDSELVRHLISLEAQLQEIRKELGI